MIVASPQRHHGVTASMLDMRLGIAGPSASGGWKNRQFFSKIRQAAQHTLMRASKSDGHR
jgi:hypothetical protein